MKYFIVLFLLIAAALPARAADAPYDIIFSEKNIWLNAPKTPGVQDAMGRAVLLDFWTYGCINCVHVAAEIKKLEEEFGGRLLVIGVHSAKFVGERDSSRIQSAAKRFGLTHPVINDSEFKIWNAFGVKAWPTLVLLGPDGREAGRFPGEGSKDQIAAALRKMHLPEGMPQATTEAQTETSAARLRVAENTPLGRMLLIADAGNSNIFLAPLDKKNEAAGPRLALGTLQPGRKDGEMARAQFAQPRGLAVTDKGVYIADTGNHLLRYFDFSGKAVTTVAGTGERGLYPQVKDREALETPLASPWDIAMLADGKTLVIAMAGLHQLWTYDTEKKTVSTLAGTAAEGIKDGPAAEATLAQPSGIAVDGDTIYFVDAESSALRMLKDGQVKTLVGTGLFDFGLVDGKYPEAMLQHPQGLTIKDGKIYIADTYNNAVRVYDIASGALSTLLKGVEEPVDVLAQGDSLVIIHAGAEPLTTYSLKDGRKTPGFKP